MLMALLAALAVAKPTIVTRGDLPPGPMLAWTVPGESGHAVDLRAVYEPGARAILLAKSNSPLLVLGRDGANGVLIAETGDEFTVWRADAGTEAQWVLQIESTTRARILWVAGLVKILKNLRRRFNASLNILFHFRIPATRQIGA